MKEVTGDDEEGAEGRRAREQSEVQVKRGYSPNEPISVIN